MDIPEKMLAWPLWGAGMEKLGKNNAPCLMDEFWGHTYYLTLWVLFRHLRRAV